MELLLDTANLEKIRGALDKYPVSGVTTNPSILGKEGSADFISTINSILEEIGTLPLHVQVVGKTKDEMVGEGLSLSKLSRNIYVKVPVTKDGLGAIKELSQICINQSHVINQDQAEASERFGLVFSVSFCFCVL